MPAAFALIHYRLFRLRRLWTLMVVSPIVAGYLALLMAGDGLLAAPGIAIGLSGSWALVTTALLARFPRAEIELLALTLATTIAVLCLPLIEMLVSLKPTRVGAGDLILLGILCFAGWFVLFMACAGLCGHFTTWGKKRTRRTRCAVQSDLPPELAFAAVALVPDTDGPMRSTGKVDEYGFFPVHVDLKMPPPEDVKNGLAGQEDPDGEIPRFIYRVRIMDAGPLWQSAIVTSPLDPDSTAYQLNVTPQKSGCLLETIEVHSNFTPLRAVIFWLTDFGIDILIAHLDAASGKPTRANRMQTFDSPLCWIARRMPKPDGPAF